MFWGMELSFTEAEIMRRYLPILKKYEVCFDEEVCNLIENCSQDLESKLQAFIGWFLSLEHRALIENKKLILPNANETLVKAITEEWYPTDFQKERLIEANLLPLDGAIRSKLAEINFFKAIAYNIPHNSHRIELFYRGQMIWSAQIAELLKVSNRGLIEMYKFRVNQHRENMAKLGLSS